MKQMDKLEKQKILIVDDERSNIITLDHILRPDYTILAAIDGKAALEIAGDIVPDLILLDIVMPGISGFEVLEALKKLDRLRRVPVVFITGLDSIEDEEKAFALGAADYIIKPFHKTIVKARIRTQLQIAEYIRTVEQLSMVDMLTQILNRRGFDDRLEVEWKRAIRDETPVSVLMVDIDKFKQYNDTFGHLRGDAALRVVADILKQSLRRPADLVARFGGEEFIVLLPNTELSGALAIAEKIRGDVAALTAESADSSVTVSIGVNTFTPGVDDSVDSFIAEADAALYFAKKTGRNRVCAAHGHTPAGERLPQRG